MTRNWPTPYQIWGIVWPVIALWIALLGFAAVTDTHMPNGRGFDVVTVALLVTAQFLIATVSLRLMKGLEGFTIALAAFLTVKNIYWLWIMSLWLWPHYMGAHLQMTVQVLRVAIIGAAVWVLVQLIRIAGIGREYDG